jgi:hypothetical protein
VHESVHATSLGYPPPPTVTRLLGDGGAGAGAPHVNHSDDEGPVLIHVSTGFTNGGGEVVPLGTVQSDVPVK